MEKVNLTFLKKTKFPKKSRIVRNNPECFKCLENRAVNCDPKDGTCRVLLCADGKLKLVSRHNAKDDCGNRKWPLK